MLTKPFSGSNMLLIASNSLLTHTYGFVFMLVVFLALTASFFVFAYILLYILLLSFNKQYFYFLLNILTYIFVYLEEENLLAIYIDIVWQISNIFDLSVALALGSINIIKKNKKAL